MDAQEMIRRYKAVDKPARQYGVKRSKWMDNLGKIDLILPIMFILSVMGAIELLKRRDK